MSLTKESGEIASYLNKIDPNNHDNITFSQCVALFSMVLLLIFFCSIKKLILNIFLGKNQKGQ